MGKITVMTFGDNPKQQLDNYVITNKDNISPQFYYYTLGGSFTNYFKVKDDNKSICGIRGTKENPPKKGYGDATLKYNIDLDGMRNDFIEKQLDKYDKIIKIIQKWVADNTIDGVKAIPKPYSYYAKMVEDGILTDKEARAKFYEKEYYKDEISKAKIFL